MQLEQKPFTPMLEHTADRPRDDRRQKKACEPRRQRSKEKWNNRHSEGTGVNGIKLIRLTSQGSSRQRNQAALFHRMSRLLDQSGRNAGQTVERREQSLCRTVPGDGPQNNAAENRTSQRPQRRHESSAKVSNSKPRQPNVRHDEKHRRLRQSPKERDPVRHARSFNSTAFPNESLCHASPLTCRE
jgi:hypothetical protein